MTAPVIYDDEALVVLNRHQTEELLVILNMYIDSHPKGMDDICLEVISVGAKLEIAKRWFDEGV